MSMMNRFKCFLLLFIFSMPLFALSKFELTNTVKKLSWDELYFMGRILDQKSEETAKNTGFVRYYPWGGSGSFYMFSPSVTGINAGKASGSSASDITAINGMVGSFVYNISETMAVGGLFGSLAGSSEVKSGANYYTYAVDGTFQMGMLRYKVLQSRIFFIDAELGAGLFQGMYSNYQTDEAGTIAVDSYRSGSGISYLIGLDLRYRLSTTVYTGVKAGYFGASLANLSRGGVAESGTSLDFSGFYVAVSLGTNF
jgi:hypothetical protein